MREADREIVRERERERAREKPSSLSSLCSGAFSFRTQPPAMVFEDARQLKVVRESAAAEETWSAARSANGGVAWKINLSM